MSTHALVDAVHQAHLAVEETVFEPIAASYAAVLPEDRARGVALLDFGPHSTDLVIYDGEALMLAASLPVWGDHFTRDIAFMLKVSYRRCRAAEDGVRLCDARADGRQQLYRSAFGRRTRAARSASPRV